MPPGSGAPSRAGRAPPEEGLKGYADTALAIGGVLGSGGAGRGACVGGSSVCDICVTHHESSTSTLRRGLSPWHQSGFEPTSRVWAGNPLRRCILPCPGLEHWAHWQNLTTCKTHPLAVLDVGVGKAPLESLPYSYRGLSRCCIKVGRPARFAPGLDFLAEIFKARGSASPVTPAKNVPIRNFCATTAQVPIYSERRSQAAMMF